MFVVGDPVGGHAERRHPGRAAVDGAGARPHEPVADRLGRGRDAEQVDRVGEGLASSPVAVGVPGDRPAADQVHHPAFVEEGEEGVADAVEDVLEGGVGDLPGVPRTVLEDRADAVEHRDAVGALVGDGRMLDEAAVAIEAVAFGDVPEDGRERLDGPRDLAGLARQDAVEQGDQAQVGAVGAGAGARVELQPPRADEVVDRRDQVVAAVADEDRDVEQPLGQPDLPVPPVAGLGRPGVVGLAHRPVDGRGDLPGERRIAGLPELPRRRVFRPERPATGRDGRPVAFERRPDVFRPADPRQQGPGHEIPPREHDLSLG